MLNPGDRKKGIWIIVLMVLNALLDFFSLASFLPLIILLVNPDFISSNKYIYAIYHTFGFPSPSWFIITLTLFVLILMLVKNIIALWITRSKANYTFTLGSDLSSRALSRYMEVSYLKFTELDFSKELNRIANLPIAFANNIIMPLATLVSEGLVFLLLLFCIIIYDLKVFTFLTIILIPIGLLYSLKRRTLKKTSRDLKEKYPLTLKYALQAVEGLFEIKALGKESFFKNRFSGLSRSLAKTFARDHTTQTGTSRLTEIIAACIICSLIIYSVVTTQNYQQTILLLGVYAGASFRIIPSLNRILNASLQIKTHEYLFHELADLMNFQPSAYRQSVSSPDFKEKIELKKISFGYTGQPRILNNISLCLQKGERIALTGKSGTGKTSLILIMLRFLHEQEGALLVDGNQLEERDWPGWRKLIGYVPQNPYILDGSVVENIAFGIPFEQADHKKVSQLIREMDLEDWMLSLPEGIHTRIGEKGVKISGGQRQRLAIARTLYHDAAILLLDEVTNQLDPATENEVISTLLNVSDRNKTILMITHHPELLKKFDLVYELIDGSLEVGKNIFQSTRHL
jgi:ATP-binding cassette, subfamily B, bacterial PglK